MDCRSPCSQSIALYTSCVNKFTSQSFLYRENIFSNTFFTSSILVVKSTCLSAIALEIYSHMKYRGILANYMERYNKQVQLVKLSPGQSHSHFQNLLSIQRRLAKKKAQDTNIISTLISIQSIVTTYVEVMHKEITCAKTLIKKDNKLSTHGGLVDLVS